MKALFFAEQGLSVGDGGSECGTISGMGAVCSSARGWLVHTWARQVLACMRTGPETQAVRRKRAVPARFRGHNDISELAGTPFPRPELLPADARQLQAHSASLQTIKKPARPPGAEPHGVKHRPTDSSPAVARRRRGCHRVRQRLHCSSVARISNSGIARHRGAPATSL